MTSASPALIKNVTWTLNITNLALQRQIHTRLRFLSSSCSILAIQWEPEAAWWTVATGNENKREGWRDLMEEINVEWDGEGHRSGRGDLYFCDEDAEDVASSQTERPSLRTTCSSRAIFVLPPRGGRASMNVYVCLTGMGGVNAECCCVKCTLTTQEERDCASWRVSCPRVSSQSVVNSHSSFLLRFIFMCLWFHDLFVSRRLKKTS